MTEKEPTKAELITHLTTMTSNVEELLEIIYWMEETYQDAKDTVSWFNFLYNFLAISLGINIASILYIIFA